MTTNGVTLGAIVSSGAGNTFGPGGFANGYNIDSFNYLGDVGQSAVWEWIGGFGGPHPMDNSDAAYFSQDGLDAHDAAWGHVRRGESNGFIYWTPNNSVCWRRPPSWPSDCAIAPAGENPPTNPAHTPTTIAANGTGGYPCCWRSDSDDFQRGSMEVVNWTPYTALNLGAMSEASTGGFSGPAVAGAITGVPSSTGAEVTNVRIRGVSGSAMYVEGGSPTITWYLIEASENVPSAGPYLVYDTTFSPYYRTAWMRGALETEMGNWTQLASATSAGQNSAWTDISDAAVASGIAGQYARVALLDYGPEIGDYAGFPNAGPSHYVIGIIAAQLTDTSPFKDTTNPNGFHRHGFETPCTVQVEAQVGAGGQYVMYDEPPAVVGDACPTVKMVNMNSTFNANDALTAVFETSVAGPVLKDTMYWDPESITSGSSYPYQIQMNAMKWTHDYRMGSFWRVTQGGSNLRTYLMYQYWNGTVLDWYDYDFWNESFPRVQMVSGNGTYWIRQTGGGVWELYRTRSDRVQDDWINDFFVTDALGNFPAQSPDSPWPGPGNRIISYDYEEWLDVFTCSDDPVTGITYTRINIPAWDGDSAAFEGYPSPFTDWQIHRISAEPGTQRIWVTAYRPNYEHQYSVGNETWAYILVACYDFASGEWTNVLHYLSDYDWYTYTGDDYSGVGFSNDGPYLIGLTTPNKVSQEDPDPEYNTIEEIAAYLGEWIIRPITLVGNTISWGGPARHLMYRDQGYYGWWHGIWGTDLWSGGIFTHVPIDMRTTDDDEQQELFINQISALTGSGTAASDLMIYAGNSAIAEMAFASCNLLKWLRLNQRDDRVGNRIAINPRLETRGAPNPASSRGLSKAPRLTKRNDHGYE